MPQSNHTTRESSINNMSIGNKMGQEEKELDCRDSYYE